MPSSKSKDLPPSARGVFGPVSWLFIAFAGFLVAVRFKPEAADYLLAQAGFPNLLDSSRSTEVTDAVNSIKYIGSANGRVEHFQNIFYARDTSGERRFAPPEPFLPPPGSEVDATKSGAWCPQGTGDILPWTSPVHNVSENCLSLRIARPAGTKSNAKLPVVVFVHGGGHALGSASDLLYTPDGLIEQSNDQGQPIIYVGINYRLGIFGYAYTDALQELKHTNNGMRDQLAAFDWIKRHIATFGGDPERVTAMGQSVGASDLALHLTAFGGGSKGVPFHRLILLSGPPSINVNTKTVSQVRERTHEVAEKLGCEGNARTDSAQITQCLREVPMEQLRSVSVTMMRTLRPPFGEAFFYPILDADIITDYSSALMRRGEFAKGLPILLSWAHNDAAWFPLPTTATDEEVLAAFTVMVDKFSEASLKKLLELYPESDFDEFELHEGKISPQYFRSARLTRDILFTCGILDFSWQYAKHGGSDVRLWSLNQTRYALVFDWMGIPFWGVSHLSELPYVFNIKDLPGGIDSSPSQLSLAKEISGEVIAFVNEKQDGQRSESYSPEWTAAYASNDQHAMKAEHAQAMNVKIFGGPEGGGMASVSRTGKPQGTLDDWIAQQKLFERCDFLNSDKIREERGV